MFISQPTRAKYYVFGQTRFCLYLLCFCTELHWQPSESMGITVNERGPSGDELLLRARIFEALGASDFHETKWVGMDLAARPAARAA